MSEVLPRAGIHRTRHPAKLFRELSEDRNMAERQRTDNTYSCQVRTYLAIFTRDYLTKDRSMKTLHSTRVQVQSNLLFASIPNEKRLHSLKSIWTKYLTLFAGKKLFIHQGALENHIKVHWGQGLLVVYFSTGKDLYLMSSRKEYNK